MLAQASIGTLKAEASVQNPEQRLDLPEKPETIKLHSAADGSAEVVLVESAAVTEATENKYAEKKRKRKRKKNSKPEQVEERIQIMLAQASIGTLKAEASVQNPEQRLDLPKKPETIKLHSAADGSAEVVLVENSKSEQVDERIQVTSAQASIGTLKAEASVHNPEQRLDLPEKPETIKLHSAAEVVQVKSAAVTGATENKYAEKLFQVQAAEEHVSRVDKGIESAFNCNGEASVDSGLVSCCEHSNGNDVKVNRQIEEVNPSSELLVSKDIRPHVDYRYKPGLMVSRKAVFKRPFVDEFLQFCFEKFAVGVWSSRTKRTLDPIVDFLMGDSKGKLLFCWDQSYCTITKFATIENRDKPLVLKELRKLWDKLESNLPWEKGAYNESNTLLLDDSPYKALHNPANTGIFPYSYHYRDAKDNSLGTRGDLRVYLESLALAGDVREVCRAESIWSKSNYKVKSRLELLTNLYTLENLLFFVIHHQLKHTDYFFCTVTQSGFGLFICLAFTDHFKFT
ncbi:hypothetical protein NL676_039902 [Syzygium grande]|nr:hypothetical protein NL676_039902 [Syzygium grande]